MNTVFSSVILALSFVSGALGQCTSYQVTNCLSDFNEYVTGLPNFKRQLKYYDDTQLTQICRLWNAGEDCYGRFKYQCDEATQLLFDGLETTYGYLCDAGFSVYPKSQECYEDDGLEAALVVCLAKYQTEADRIQRQLQSVSTQSEINRLKRNYCDGVNDVMFACITEALYMTEVCSEESIRFQLDLSEKALKPLLGELDCSVVEQCASARVKRCTDGLDNADSQNWDEYHARTSDEINTLCQHYTDYEKCLSPFKSECSHKVKSSLELSDSSQRICKGEAAYLDVSCLNETVEAEATVCYRRGNAKIKAIEANPSFPTISEQEKEDYCSAVNDDILDCVSEVLGEYCDDDFVKSQFDINKAFWEPTVAGMGCSLSHGPQGPPTGSAVFLLPSIAVYLCSILLIVCNQVM